MNLLSKISIFLGLVLCIETLQAEPYLAVRTGMKCMTCHVNPAGGGKRTAYGQIYGQTVLPEKAATAPLGEMVSRYLDIGGDMRTSLTASKTPGDDGQLAFTSDRATFYVEGKLIPNRLTVYLDQRFAPGMSSREAWMMYKTEDQKWFAKAGAFFLPFGLRIEDDTAFIREATGISFNNADNGLMLGHDHNNWSSRVAITNGTNGGAETNTSKQITMRGVYIEPTWRAGASLSLNKGDEGTSRNMFNVFGATNMFWDVEVLAELDLVTDKEDGKTTNQQISFIEFNKEVKKGHNVKFTYEYLDPDTDQKEDQRLRTSLVWEYTPFSLTQIRVGARFADGIPQNPAENTDQLFTQLHVWF